MVKFLLTLFAFLYFTMAHAGDTLRALFIGNSYTEVNNLPNMVSRLAAASGDSLYYQVSAPGGQTFQQHCVNSTTINLIAQGNWDFVVLQEQSQRPSFEDAQVANEVYPYAKYLDSLVHHYNACAQTVFYMTWGRKNGDASNCAFWPPVCTYQGMDSLLQLRYSIMADDNNSWISPVAKLWRNLRNNNPGINLYQADESHPSAAGTYAAAVSFYSLLFGKNPVPNTYNFTLSTADANAIKAAAKTVVFDSLDHWRMFTTLPVIDSIAIVPGVNGLTIQCTGLHPQNVISFSWSFGDGSPNSFANGAIHTYASPGTYTVCLTVSSSLCAIKTYCQTIVIDPVNIKDIEFWEGLSVYPNPTNDYLYCSGLNKKLNYTITNSIGIKITSGAIDKQRNAIELKALPAGIYFINVVDLNGNNKVMKVVKR